MKQTPRKWSLELCKEQRLLGGLIGGVEVTEENCTRPLEDWSPPHAETFTAHLLAGTAAEAAKL